MDGSMFDGVGKALVVMGIALLLIGAVLGIAILYIGTWLMNHVSIGIN